MAGLILVLGSTGNIGKPLVQRLLDAGHRVRAGTRHRPDDLDPRAEWVPFDYTKSATYPTAFQNVERLFLNTPAVPDMVQLTAMALDAAKKAGVQRVVKLSAYNAGPRAPFTFGQWHHQAELIVDEADIPYTFLRPNGFMQNYLGNPAATVRQLDAFYAPTGEGKVSFIDARDIAACAAVTLIEEGHARETYDLTGPEAISNQEIAQLLTQITGRQIRFLPVSDADAGRALKNNGLPDWLINAIVELQTTYKVGEAAEVSTSVKDLTGNEPTSFLQFAQEHRSAFAK